MGNIMNKIEQFFVKIKLKIRKNKEKRKLIEYNNIKQQAINQFDITEIENVRFLKIKPTNSGVLIPIEYIKDISSTLNYLRNEFIKTHI